MEFVLLLILVFFQSILGFEEKSFPIVMPNVRPKLPKNESYLCTAVTTDPTKELYIREIQPRVSMDKAHHLMLVGCSNKQLGSSKQNLWNCGGSLGEDDLEFGGSCQGGEMQVLYMWSGNGSGIRFPEDSGFRIGGKDSPIQMLVLQVHYIENRRIPRSGDSSGVLLKYRESEPYYDVGIFSLHSHGIAPPNGYSNWDSACNLVIPENQTLTPFAFLTHTHGLGIMGSIWIVDQSKDWTLIGRANPQDPQSFYPVSTDQEDPDLLRIDRNRVVASRCVMKSGRSRKTMQGLASYHEMCDIFVLYKTKGRILPVNSCTKDADFSWKKFGLENEPLV